MDAMPPSMTHEARLDRLAQVAVNVGLGLEPGQEVVLTAPLQALPLVRRITEHAYRAGASQVTTLFSDEEATLARFRLAPDAAFDHAPAWLFEGMAAAYRAGAARSPSAAKTRRCSPNKTRTASPAPTAPAPSPTARRWS